VGALGEGGPCFKLDMMRGRMHKTDIRRCLEEEFAQKPIGSPSPKPPKDPQPSTSVLGGVEDQIQIVIIEG